MAVHKKKNTKKVKAVQKEEPQKIEVVAKLPKCLESLPEARQVMATLNINKDYGSTGSLDIGRGNKVPVMFYPDVSPNESARSAFFSEWANKILDERKASKKVAMLEFDIEPLTKLLVYLEPDEPSFEPFGRIMHKMFSQLLDIEAFDADLFEQLDDSMGEACLYDMLQDITDEIVETLDDVLSLTVAPTKLTVFGKPKRVRIGAPVVRLR